MDMDLEIFFEHYLYRLLILDAFFILFIILFSILLLEIQAKSSCAMSNLYLDFPDDAMIEFWLLYS